MNSWEGRRSWNPLSPWAVSANSLPMKENIVTRKGGGWGLGMPQKPKKGGEVRASDVAGEAQDSFDLIMTKLGGGRTDKWVSAYSRR